MKKPSQKRDVFRGPQKSCQNHIFRGSLRQSRPKNKILNRFAIFLGSRNGTKKSADTGRCQAFQIREASISEAPPSEACPPYLPAPPRGIKMASTSNFFSASNFGIIFGMPFFNLFDLFIDLGSHFGFILASFCILFACLFPAPFLHRCCIDFSNFLHAQNQVFYLKNK